MTRYVIGPDVAMRLAHDQAVIGDEHQVLAPTLLRSQMLSSLYQALDRGEMTRKDAERRLNYVLPQRQADALITLDGQLANAVKDLVTVAPIEALS